VPSKNRTYSADVVQHVPTGMCCRSNVGRQGELTVEYHPEVPGSQGRGQHRVVEGGSQVVGGRAFPIFL